MKLLLRTLYASCMVWVLAACTDLVRPGTEFEPPRVSLADIRIADVGLLEQRYVLDLRIQNPNPAALPITGLEYSLNINGDRFGHGVSAHSVRVPPYGEAMVTVDLVSTTGKALDQIRRLARGEPAAIGYQIEGGLQLKGWLTELPFTFEGQVNSTDEPAESDRSLL